MTMNPNVFIGSHAVEMAAVEGGKQPLMARAASVRSRGGTPAGSPCNLSFEIKRNHPNVHLKTKAHWIIGWVPPPPSNGKRRRFFAARRWVVRGFVRYWGFVYFDGRRHYGWIDALHLVQSTRAKGSSRPGSYDDYRNSVVRLMKRAWRYRRRSYDELNKVPVRVLIPFDDSVEEVKLYKNRKETPENFAVTVKRNDPRGFRFNIRYATRSWILVKYGKGHEWYFLKAPYRDIKLNPGRLHRNKRTQTMTSRSIPPSWA